MNKTRTIYFTDDELWDRLREAADARNMSTSALIVQAVFLHLKDSKLCPTCNQIRKILCKKKGE